MAARPEDVDGWPCAGVDCKGAGAPCTTIDAGMQGLSCVYDEINIGK